MKQIVVKNKRKFLLQFFFRQQLNSHQTQLQSEPNHVSPRLTVMTILKVFANILTSNEFLLRQGRMLYHL